LHGTEFAQS